MCININNSGEENVKAGVAENVAYRRIGNREICSIIRKCESGEESRKSWRIERKKAKISKRKARPSKASNGGGMKPVKKRNLVMQYRKLGAMNPAKKAAAAKAANGNGCNGAMASSNGQLAWRNQPASLRNISVAGGRNGYNGVNCQYNGENQ
jgi:hypothetical protein